MIGEGAAIMVLEEMEHAQRRGARIHAELVGFGTNSDGVHVTKPEKRRCAGEELALRDAGLEPRAIGYVNGHGTATEQRRHRRDARHCLSVRLRAAQLAEELSRPHARRVRRARSVVSIEMMNAGWFAPTLNLENVDPRCGELDYLVGSGRELNTSYVMNNNFAFGGVNTR